MAAARSGPTNGLPVPPDLLRSVLDNLLEGCQVIGPDYRYLYVNAAAARQGRSAPEALVGRTMMEAYPGIDATEMFGELRRCMEERASGRMESEFAFPDGSLGWFELHFEPVPEGVVILSIDITGLRRAEARIRTIYDHLPHAALVWRASDGEGFAVVDSNRAARVLTDAFVADAEGITAFTLELVVPHLVRDLERCLSERTPREREVDCVVSGGPLRMALTYGFVPPDMVVLHAQDVTSERRAEEQLAGAQRLEAVARLAGGVAHDFNNLLGIILTSAEFALVGLDPSDPARNDVEQVREAAERAGALTKQLLAFGRRQMLEPTVTSFDDVVDGLAGVIRSALGEDIDLELHPAREPGHVLVDPGQLERVLLNLALNARAAMPRGGKVTIETSNVDLDGEYVHSHGVVRPGPYVCLSVADTGIGMPEHVRERVFEPFFTTKGEGVGSGLGLASVYGIVKQSGGYIWVYSEPGRGTTFKIYLPRVDEAPSEPGPTQAREGASTGHETILVVEDEEGVRRASERILAGAGYRVLAAAGGPDALALCEEHGGAVDLLLTDVIMPGMSGPELAERVVSAWPHVKVLFMSGYAPRAIMHHGVLDAGTQLIPKPFSVKALRRKVREVLDGQ